MLLLRRHRRPAYMSSVTEESRPKLIVRIIVGTVALVVIWFILSKVWSLFSLAVAERASTSLTIDPRSTSSVEVSIHGGDWQRGENGLKLYTGDKVAVRSGGSAILSFFDGSRVRMDERTEAEIQQMSRRSGKPSSVEIDLHSGRVWVSTPSLSTYSGAIVRQVHTLDMDITLPAGASGLLSNTMIAMLKGYGLGAQLDIKKPGKIVTVGEGQFFTLTAEALRAIASGRDPYDYRAPIYNQPLWKQDFIIKSYVLFKNVTMAGASGGAAIDSQYLMVVAPEDQSIISSRTIQVAGRVNAAIRTLTVNNQDIPIRADSTFTTEVKAGADKKTTIHIEALDEQGFALASVDRTVVIQEKVPDPVRLTAPVGSGGTFTTSKREVEITGEAPAGTAGVLVNDYRLQLFRPGSKTWGYLASVKLQNLVQGKNLFSISAIDQQGRRSPPVTMTIVVSDQATLTGGTVLPIRQNAPLKPATLSVTAPAPGRSVQTSRKEVVIEGKTDADTASVSVNGYQLSLYQAGKTTWNYIASVELGTMQEGKNVYRIVARNKDGEILDVLEYTMTYNP